jgi:hypothetical protein
LCLRVFFGRGFGVCGGDDSSVISGFQQIHGLLGVILPSFLLRWGDDTQIVFCDSPGVLDLQSQRQLKLPRHITTAPAHAISQVDHALVVIDASSLHLALRKIYFSESDYILFRQGVRSSIRSWSFQQFSMHDVSFILALICRQDAVNVAFINAR